MRKYLILDPKPSDLTMIRVIKARTGRKIRMSTYNSPSESEPFAINQQIAGIS